MVVKQQQQNLMTRLRTTIETIGEAVGNNAVEATEAWKEVLEQMLRDVGRVITKLEGLYQEESNITTDNAEEIFRRQGEDSQVLDTQLTRAKVALANRRPTNGPAGSNAPQRAGSVEST